MRSVEHKMVNSLFGHGRPGRVGKNTVVAPTDTGGRVELHGNVIASYNALTGDLTVTLAGWPTVTTRSRVNAILDAWNSRHGHYEAPPRIYQAEHVQFIEEGDGPIEIDSRDVLEYHPPRPPAGA